MDGELAAILLRFLPLGVLAYDESGTILEANAYVTSRLGYGHDELVGAPRFVIEPNDTRTLSETPKVRAPDAHPDGMEVVHLRKDGSPVRANLRHSTAVTESGKICITLVHYASRERWDVAPPDSTDHTDDPVVLASMVEMSPAGIVFIRADGKVTFANPRAEEILGLERSGIESRKYDDPNWKITSIDGGPFADSELPFARVMSTRRPVLDVCHAIERSDGSKRLLSVSAAPRFSDDGAITGVVATIEDITDRVHAEERFRESVLQFRNIFEGTPMGIHHYRLTDNDELVLINMNGSAERILGIRSEDVVGKTIEEAFPPLADTEVPERYRRAARYGESWRTEEISYHDERISGAYSVYAFQTSSNHMAALFLDVAERRRAEQERRALEHELRRSQRMEAIGKLAGGIAHDFNNLLQVITGHTTMALDALDAEHPSRESLDEITKATRRAADLISQLLSFSRRQIIMPQVCDLNEIVLGVIGMLDRIIGEDIRIEFSPGRDIGSVFVDRGLIEQVVFNICVNSRDAMPQGGALTIETAMSTIDDGFRGANPWAAPGRYVLMTVTDTGVGMDADTRDHIFEPFYSTKGEAKGTGLGLSTVYGTIQQHHGMIQVQSELGRGTAFKVYLPESDRPAQPNLKRLSKSMPKGSEHILVAEDEPNVLDLTRRMLEDAGYKVSSTGDGEAALSEYLEQRDSIDLLILDVVMPKLGGKEVHDAIRGLGSDVPILFVSGYSQSFFRRDNETDTFFAVVRKPFRREELLQAVGALLAPR